MSDFIKINIIEAKPVYSTQKNQDDQLRELLCGVTIVDPTNNKPINVSLDVDSTRILVMGGLQYLGETGDQIAINMVNTFMNMVDTHLPEQSDDDV